MNREEMRKILEEVDILLLLAERGRMEARNFAWHMFVWGLYVALNMTWSVLGQLWPGGLPLTGVHWFHTLFVAFFFATLPTAGWRRSLLWVGAYLLTMGVYTATHSAAWTVGILVGMIAVISMALYREKTGEGPPRRPTLFGYIGMLWGLLFGSFWWALSLFPEAQNNIVFTLWITHVFGAGLLASVILHPGFFWMGLLILFLGPLLLKLGVLYLMAGYALAGYAMAGLGYRIYRHDS